MFLLKINHLQATAIHKYVGLFGLLLIVLGLLVFSTAQPVEAADPLECSSHEFSIRTTPEGGVTMLAGPEGQQEIPGGTEQLAVVQEGCREFGGENIYWFSLLDPSEASSEGYTFFQKKGNEYFQIEDLDDLSWGGPGSSSDSVVITYVNDRRDEQTVTVGNFSIARGYLQNEVIVDEDGVGVAPGSDAAEDAAEEELACADYVGIIGWALCPITNILGSTLDFTASVVESLLQVPNVYFEADPNGDPPPIKEAWAIIRNIAFTILVPMTLVMVISTALGFEIFSAYTVKKALPRLIFATIFIALSWDLIVLAITVVNGLGAGIAGIITSPIGGFNNSSLSDLISFGGDKWISAFGLLGLGVAGTAAAIGGYGVIFITLAIFVLTILTVLLLLLLREVLIVSLAIFAPIALLAWVFPANTKLWSLWRGSFVKLLLLYPLIMLLLASGRVVAYVAAEGGSFEGIGFQSTVLVLVAYLGPFVFIPTAFRYVGGVFGNIAGMVNDKEKGLFDRGRRLRGGIMKNNLAKAAQGSRWNNQSKIGRKLNTFGQSVAQVPRAGLRPSRWRSNVASGREISDMQQLQEIAKHPDAQPIINDDDMLSVAIDGAKNGWNRSRIQQEIAEKYNGRFKTSADQAQAAANVESYLALGSHTSTGLAAVVAKTGTKTGYQYSDNPQDNQNGIADAVADIQAFSGGDTALERSAIAASVSGFGSAKRYDQAGAGVGGAIAASKSLRDGTSRSQVGQTAVRKSLTTQGPGAILAGPKEAAKPLVDEKLRMLQEAHSAHKQNPTNKTLEEAFVAELASADSLVDMGGQAAPDVRDYTAQTLHGAVLDEKPVSQMVDEVSASPETSDIFGRYKRNYKKQYGDDAERMRRQGLPTNQPALFEPPDLGAGPPTGL